MRFVQAQPLTKQKNLDDSMIPAINIVFLLLIFFMIAGHIEARNTDLLIPQSKSYSELEIKDILIEVSASGEYLINGKKFNTSLTQALADLNLSPESMITCKVHKTLPVTVLDPILNSVRTLGIRHLNIATESQS